ncbi:hypothetical protein GPL24_14310 [Anaerostipes hadrus]|uniref:FGGY family carbohydrate kinase n=1 Tax=Anaerostipes hadrus TaxID=649756 RepID=UPI001C024A43|nr:hypothetical protein [Anaerostipes hadrus]
MSYAKYDIKPFFLFNDRGITLRREDLSHKQIINDLGLVSHNPEEIYQNTIYVIKKLVTEAGIDKNKVAGIGAAYLAGIALGIYDKTIFDQIKCDKYEPLMEEERWKHKKYGWKKIIQSACEKN